MRTRSYRPTITVRKLDEEIGKRDAALVALSATFGAWVKGKFDGGDDIRRTLEFAIEGVPDELEKQCVTAMYECIHGATINDAIAKATKP